MYKKVYAKFQKDSIEREKFFPYMGEILGVFDEDLILELLRDCGLWIEESGDRLELGTLQKDIKDGVFCFVDIETTGSKPNHSSIIEIGAIKYHGGEIIDTFETLVFSQSVPENITELTGIDAGMLADAPSEREVLQRFRKFLGNSVFVAHNVVFDYGFISDRLLRYNEPYLLNPRLCTVELARRGILSARYSLGHLNAFLGIGIDKQHRALSDAFICLKVFEIAQLTLPNHVQNIQGLIEYTRGKKL
ncbi:3'-5' exonuclease [Helicobacter mustelae]|uniref:Putative dna polymerase III epsilon subunit n=1 Tax=Helicobacter mustelae (strain ATCC 43772 / CCUG 25715 / CIP 103759 / LMG 18044 / NCTC 12198 / R85-136P) TaxID=679897 RepID=D3UFM4_HELM1|nr:3'-5' exonuclease [Helicobacter mustelae]CBG39295.1 Putative dna polymerase III epsilon subunit [Helicobacter mustelae 12198]SQH70806.1 DNA polymerase III subunit epsilon [Helicobacter mustelae]STP11931.1 DNA polymerase III subunit epsilon [Helicobacter mustelae]